MGARGPVPKRSENRKRRNKPNAAEGRFPVTKAQGSVKVTVPNASKDWCAASKRIYKGLRDSGQARFFEPSDWALAYFLMDEITRYVEQGRQNGQVLASLLSGLSSLLVSEGDRRRVGLELSRGGDTANEDRNVAVMEEWRKRMGG